MKTIITIISFLILSTAVCGQSSEKGEINGAPYQIIIPENWNKGLVMYAHGYEETDEYLGGYDEEEELEEAENEEEGGNEEEFHDIFTNRGYAIAFSEFRKKGLVVKEGIEGVGSSQSPPSKNTQMNIRGLCPCVVGWHQ